MELGVMLILLFLALGAIDLASESKFWTRMVDAAKKRAREML